MTTLQDQLDEITANTRQLVQAERLAVGERAVAELFESGIEERILPVGATGAGVCAEGCQRAAGAVAKTCWRWGRWSIKFFRGRWCSYCVTELEAWRDLYGTLREREVLMVAIGPQTARQSDFMAGPAWAALPRPARPRLRAGGEVRRWSTPFPSTMRDYYLSILVNLPFVNGEASWRLPLPATYVIGRDGRVLFAEAHADFRVRPEPEEALAAAFGSEKAAS